MLHLLHWSIPVTPATSFFIRTSYAQSQITVNDLLLLGFLSRTLEFYASPLPHDPLHSHLRPSGSISKYLTHDKTHYTERQPQSTPSQVDQGCFRLPRLTTMQSTVEDRKNRPPPWDQGIRTKKILPEQDFRLPFPLSNHNVHQLLKQRRERWNQSQSSPEEMSIPLAALWRPLLNGL